MTKLRSLCVLWLVSTSLHAAEEKKFLSHPPIRPLPQPSQRAKDKGPAFFVDPAKGNNDGAGTEQAPWKTIQHALPRLNPGDTLYLRDGTYFENVYCAVAGRKEAPITIRSYPGELAILDGGLQEFQLDPEKAWQVGGLPQGEYRSVKSYKNIRDVVGLFGDSLVGLQTYWHTMDLCAQNELWIDDPDKKLMVKPVYCGPGIWYDKQTGHIHIRLAHTHNTHVEVANYRGETDPRKLPLIIAPFNSVPLFVDQAKHVRFQDLVIRGGGQNTVVLQMGIDVEFDHVNIYCATYGLRARSTGPLRFLHSSIQGNIPPWAWRDENGLYTYSPRYYDPFVPPEKPTNERNICRLPTHALLVTEGSYEFEVFHYPYNHDWEIAYSEFTDGHDGVYLSGRHINFHHNWVDGFQDDAVYLSSPSPFFNDEIHIHENLITRCFSAFACNTWGGPKGNIYIYRNVADLRQGVQFSRGNPKKPEGNVFSAHIFLTHGYELLGIESIHFYQNTFLAHQYNAGFGLRTWAHTAERSQRRIFNNIFVYLKDYPAIDVTIASLHDIQLDGNLHWCAVPAAKLPDKFLDQVRACPASKKNQKNYPPGWAANDLVGDPKFQAFDRNPAGAVDYRLQKDSPALGKGVALPKEWKDAFQPKDGARPDIGAPARRCGGA